MHSERDRKPEEALDILLSACARAGLDVSFSEAGARIQTTSCEVGAKGQREFLGRGKGRGLQSRVSALAEALEHKAHSEEPHSEIASQLTFDAEHFSSRFLGVCPDFRRLYRDSPLRLSCAKYFSVGSEADPIDFPLILGAPAYVPRSSAEKDVIERPKLYRYSTNSGTAFGLSESEATLHALNELIERDSLGVEFMESILSADPRPVRELDVKSLPESSADLVRTIEDESRGKFRAWEITTDIEVPSFLCSISTGVEKEYQYFGSGTSLSYSYAFERAALEALQVMHIQRDFGVRLQKPRKRSEQGMSLYQRCGLDAGYFRYGGGAQSVSYADRAPKFDVQDELPPAAQVEIICERLEACGIQSFKRVVLEEEGLHVVQVVAPELERLYLISHGIPVVPSARGRSKFRARA